MLRLKEPIWGLLRGGWPVGNKVFLLDNRSAERKKKKKLKRKRKKRKKGVSK